MPSELRPSLKKTIADRYATQRAGGAFNAKEAGQIGSFDMGLQEKIWTAKNFVAADAEGLGMNGFKKYNQSRYLQGFNNRKYKG